MYKHSKKDRDYTSISDKKSKEHVENFHFITIINKKYDQQQHGFVKNKSTTTNVFPMTQFIENALDNHLQVDVIYNDSSKEFDKLRTRKHLEKLYYNGFEENFPFFRKLHTYPSVNFKAFTSYIYYATSGIPRGSILGPLFNIIYINDIGIKLIINYNTLVILFILRFY